jgi:type I restriction enzyme S subunit
MEIVSSLSRNLEKVADAYFRAWFVDYNVTSSNIEHEVHSSLNGIPIEPEYFGNRFVETELGLIPEGWIVANLGEYCDIFLGGTPSRSKSDYWNGDIPWINSGKINDFRITSPSELITQKGLDKSSAKLMPIGTTVLAITGATLGQYSRLEIVCCANQSVIGVLPKRILTNNFIYLTIKNDINQLIDKQTGGAQQHINRNDVITFKFVLPPAEIVEAFNLVVDPIFTAISGLANG